MSGTPAGDPGKPIKQRDDDLSEVMGQLSVTTNNSRKNSLSLSDMPIDVVALITKKLDYKEHLKLRKVSKSLRALVDNQKPACKSIRLDLGLGDVCITLNNHIVVYADHKRFHLAIYNCTLSNVIRDDFKKAAFDDLASTLKNQKLQLEYFMIENFSEKKDIDEYYNNIRSVFESLNHQVSVKEIEFRVTSPPCLLSILPYLKPGFLEKISLSIEHRGVDWTNDSIGMDKVALLEQWKQAKELYLWNKFDEFPMKYATHFKRFEFVERHLDINRNKFIRIRNFLSKLRNFEQCTLPMSSIQIPDFVSQVLGAPVSTSATEDVFHYSIPDSDYYLEFKKATRSTDFEITKKKR